VRPWPKIAKTVVLVLLMSLPTCRRSNTEVEIVATEGATLSTAPYAGDQEPHRVLVEDGFQDADLVRLYGTLGQR
jgi:hypothetical protein